MTEVEDVLVALWEKMAVVCSLSVVCAIARLASEAGVETPLHEAATSAAQLSDGRDPTR